MEEYPEELRTPPVSLISLVGCPELHSLISTHLHSDQPPINTLALPDFSAISIMNRFNKEVRDPVAGILKKDWLLKHRTRVPAVVAALFTSDHVSGDPAQWLELCTHVENLKAVVRARNIKLVLVVVQSTSKDDISEDRVIALRKRAELDSKYLITFIQNDASELEQSLNRLGSIFSELANTYYRDEGRRIKTRVEKKNANSVELNIRYCFKIAVYAEFRRDWAEALRFYEDAYHALREMVGMATRLPATQRLIEIKTVAEQLHFKISTLLLHGGKVIEAVKWFRQHSASYRKLVGVPEVMFLHWDWMSRQSLVFSELLETSSVTSQSISSLVFGTADNPLTEWEFIPAYHYQLAAHYLKEKKCCLELALSMTETAGEMDDTAESVVPSVYVGQFARLIEQGDGFAMQPLTDEEYFRYALEEGKRFQDSFEIIALLKKSFESYSNLKIQRMASLCGLSMGREYFAIGDFSNAKSHFDNIANLYRQEGWVNLLWEVLGYLRECSRRHGSMKDFIEYSLEMAAMPISSDANEQPFNSKECGPAGPPTIQQREIINKEILGFVRGELSFTSVDNHDNSTVTEAQPLHLEIDLVSPLRVVFLASVAFQEQIVKPGAPTLIMLSLLSHLPISFEIDQLEVQFNQSHCNFTIINAQRPPSTAISSDQQGCRVETAPVLALFMNKWLRLRYEIKSEQSGKLECISVIARIGHRVCICCRVESPASMDDLPLWRFEDRVDTYPTKDPALSFSGQKAIQVEEPDPLVDLNLDASGPALVGEKFIVPVTVIPRGHAIHGGELKFNLVDARGGVLVGPGDMEPMSTADHHVELVGIAGLEGEEECETGPDNIRKIQHSFGLVSVPFLNCGDMWTCKLEIKWHQPKSVILFVSLGYSLHSNESITQKVHVHKSLQIEGKTAIVVNHRFMLPFRQDPLLLSRMKTPADAGGLTSLPLNGKSVLIVNARNCTEIPLQLMSISIEADDDGAGRSCTVEHGGEDMVAPTFLVPGEEFKKVFHVTPEVKFSKLGMGTVFVRWRRESGAKEQEFGCKAEASADGVVTKHELPDVRVELSPLIVRLECPPHAILGVPFIYAIKIQNQTNLLQEIKYSLGDSQSFVLSGPHNDIAFILPKTEHSLRYMLVPLASGSQQLPRFTVTSARYEAGFQPTITASTIFVFPSKPQYDDVVGKGDISLESVAA